MLLTLPKGVIYHAPRHPASVEKAVDRKTPDLKRILGAWKGLGATFDLTYFWMKFLWPEVKQVGDFEREEEAIKLGSDLKPLVRVVRNLCYRIHWVYEEMNFGGTYSGEYLDSIRPDPKVCRDFSRVNELAQLLPTLWRAVNTAFGNYESATGEFSLAVSDPDYGKEMEAPSHLSVAELVIRNTKGRIYEVVLILNNVYKSAGYEEPFEMITRDYSKA